VGDSPFSVSMGDLDGDGALDLAIVNHISDDVSVLLGSGDGTFAAAVDYVVGYGPWSVAVGNLNGDGALDLAVANNGSDNVSVLLGNGDGTFAAAVDYGAGMWPESVAMGDLDGDGALDLAVANHGSDNVSVLINNSSSTPVDSYFFAALTPSDDAVQLRWLLPNTPNGAGVLVYRALSEDGSYRRLTEEPLPCSATGSYVDETVWPGGAFWYELRILLDNGDEIPAMGTRSHADVPPGPVGSISYVAPNPSPASMTIGYALPEHCKSASLSVYDVGGRLVRRLRLSDSGAAGLTATWDGMTSSGHRAASGVYLLRLEADGESVSRKAVLLR